MEELEIELKSLQELNPHLSEVRGRTDPRTESPVSRVMVAGSGLTAKRMVLALDEEGISSVVPVCDGERGRSWYEFADEPVFIGPTPGAEDTHRIIAACVLAEVDAVYPAYDFLRLNPDFPEELSKASGDSIRIMGPDAPTLRRINARNPAKHGEISAKRRIVVQLMDDIPLGIRARSEESGLEESGPSDLDAKTEELFNRAREIARELEFSHGTASVEFLETETDIVPGAFRPGLETGCAVLEEALGLDLASAHVRRFIVGSEKDPLDGSYKSPRTAIGCRIFAHPSDSADEDVVRELEPAGFRGVRNDFALSQGDRPGTGEVGLVGETIVHGSTRRAALTRLERALRELYLRGVRTNLDELLRMVRRELEEVVPSSRERREFQEDTPAIFGAFTEYLSAFSRTAMKLALQQDPERGLGDPRMTRSPTSFRVTMDGITRRVDFMRLDLNRYCCFVDQKFRGDISLSDDGRGQSDDYGILYGNRSLRVRVDRIGSELVLYTRDTRNRARYIPMEVVVGDARPPGDLGAVRAPIQGTFVRFGESDGRSLKVGDTVKQGDLILVLSSMKMETSVRAPVSGKIGSLIEDGRAERLTLGHTPDGRTIGKPLAESELLAVIGNGRGDSDAMPIEDIRDTIFTGSFKEYALTNFAESLPFLLELADSYFRGFIQQEHVIRDLSEILDVNLEKGNPGDTREPFPEILESMLMHYGGIRRLFSPELAGDLSFFAEFGVFAYGPRPDDYQPSEKFAALISSLFNSYGIKRRSDEIFLLFQRAYHASREHPELLRALLDLSYYKFPKNTALFLGDFMNTGRYARLDLDRALVEFMLLKKRLRRPRRGSDQEHLAAAASDAKFNLDGVPHSFPTWAGELAAKVAERENITSGIPSPRERVVLFGDEGAGSYLAVTWAEPNLDGIRGAYREGLETLAAAVRSEYRENNHIEILTAPGCELDLIGRLAGSSETGTAVIARDDLRAVLAAERITAGNVHLAGGHLRIAVRTLFEASPRPASVLFQEKRGGIQLEYLAESDPRNPRASEPLRDPRDAKVFSRSKWPIEYWAELAFDSTRAGGDAGPREIRVPSIDGEGETSPVGARLYAGLMHGSPALFFMKDSRVKGGATGNLEGLKYVAAVFLARRHGTALYIWNDGAGANIKEGIPALNRAAQGFMMNAIFAENVSPEEFEQYTLKNHDPALRELFAELDEKFADATSLFGSAYRAPAVTGGERPLLTAVGTGSSAGLDVYGSSQAVLQVMLDSEQSYRVLTGSNVIRAVTGEDISNYDIGGGEVMGGLTGIVDRVAENKLELVDVIRRLHDLFARKETHPGILRPENGASSGRAADDLVVLSETDLKADLDHGEFLRIKGEYRAAGSLVGGFGRLGGRRVLIMGPRSRFGLRGAASTIRARELLRIGNRTGTPRLLVIGRRWFQRISRHEPGEWRARSDFMKTLNDPGTPQINIVTHLDGMQAAELNSRADIVIFVRGDERPPRFARENASFIADSRSQAFDLACRLLDYLEGGDRPDFAEPAGKPGIPEDITRPYDIIETVIQPVVDRESFLEVFREMNDPVKGPSLVTGFARLGGKVTGIIADQPLIMGGAPDAPGTEKFRVFTELLNRFNIPLLMLSNAPGFMPGTRQERLRIQAVGGESLDVNVLGHIPVVSVVLNQNYGGRLIHAFGKHLRPGIVYIAPPDALLAVMGASAAFDLFYGPKFNELMQAGQKEEAGELHRKFFEEFNEKSRAASDAAKTGSVDWLIPDISELREHLIKGLAKAREHCAEVFES